MKFLKEHAILIGLLITGAFLRFYRIDFQSLWLDELYTLREADPGVTVSQTLEMVGVTRATPLFFSCSKNYYLKYSDILPQLRVH